MGACRPTPGCWGPPRRRWPVCGASSASKSRSTASMARLRAAVRQATAALQPPDGVQWIVDVDPLEML